VPRYNIVSEEPVDRPRHDIAPKYSTYINIIYIYIGEYLLYIVYEPIILFLYTRLRFRSYINAQFIYIKRVHIIYFSLAIVPTECNNIII